MRRGQDFPVCHHHLCAHTDRIARGDCFDKTEERERDKRKQNEQSVYRLGLSCCANRGCHASLETKLMVDEAESIIFQVYYQEVGLKNNPDFFVN